MTFGDAPVRVEIYVSEDTVEIFIEADLETHPEEPELARNYGLGKRTIFELRG